MGFFSFKLTALSACERSSPAVSDLSNIRILAEGCLSPTISFVFHHQHHADIAAILAEQQIALRSGEHCAKPYLRYLAQNGTLRISLAHYNVQEDLDRFFTALDFALDILEN